jgi:hypothetical protein
MVFEPQNRLEESLVKAASDPASRPQFLKDLMESDLFIIDEEGIADKSGLRRFNEGDELRVRPIDWNGEPYTPVFSSLSRLQAFIQREAGYLAANALDLMNVLKDANLLLNPGSDYGKEFPKEEIATILDGSIFGPSERWVVTKETQVRIGQPAVYPIELVKALTRLFKRTPEVRRAWVAHFFNPERNEPAHTLVAIEVTGDWNTVMASAGMVARDVPSPHPPVDFLQIRGGGGLEDYFLRGCKPFYEKKRFGMF